MSDSAQPTMDFSAKLQHWQQRSETALSARLPTSQQIPTRLHEAMRYSVLAGGKRIRPALMYATATILGLDEALVDGAACAVEIIHAYSLIHDDLPAMDNDDLRRGKPTCHKAFNEALAILAGDSLQVLAFAILANDPSLPSDPAIRITLVKLLAHASGTFGMAGGQALDLAAAGQQVDIANITRIHEQKTGALISASVLMAAACVPALDEKALHALGQYSRCLGLAFQIQDDLLDIEGDAALLGKATGADQLNHKPTYPTVAGIAESRTKVQSLHAEAIEALNCFGDRAELLRALADWLVLRRY